MFTHRSASKMKVNISSTTIAHLTQGAFYVLLLLTGTLLVYSRPAASTKVSSRRLTFAQRVSYQRALEEVYWRHRIWPKGRPIPKPSLDVVMSQAQLEKKVEDYLRTSQVLEDCWQRPITPEQLQTEMDRMAQHTKQPEMLLELFEVLGNDPFVIAECLARPLLTERLIADLSGEGETGRFESPRTSEIRRVSIAANLRQVAYTVPAIASPSVGCIVSDDR